MPNKHKIINDPVFGFISIPNRILDVVQHRYVQRLTRIRQLGLSCYVYPGAVHTRFLHSIGAMHLMGEAITQLRAQGHEISAEEAEAARMAILLHDIGHGPFSHVMEHSLVSGISHEEVSSLMMQRINSDMNGRLDMAISIFENHYEKPFLHQLVSSQLDTDRLDYLSRDSFFCGVSEGMIGSARLLKMLNVSDDRLVIESKGIYSVEKFLVARRLMYWQVYLHKTSVGAEQMLLHIMHRAKELAARGVELYATPALRYFLYNQITENDFRTDEQALAMYAALDDSDLWSAIKVWTTHQDKVLSLLCQAFIDRRLFRAETLQAPPGREQTDHFERICTRQLGIDAADAHYFWDLHTVTTDTYHADDERINILMKDGSVCDISEASDMLNIDVLTRKATKLFYYTWRL
ncbi:MAG: HD domain-containing protein [Paludibacteraceae bacterium]|nr:HD domain-containing protein [Paludibacteraceae bacterium]